MLGITSEIPYLRVRLIIVIIALTYFCLIQVCTLRWDNLINRCIFYPLDCPPVRLNNCAQSLRRHLNDFFVFVHKFRIFSLNRVSWSLDAELSVLSYNKHIVHIGGIATRILSSGHEFQLMAIALITHAKLMKTDENLKRNERCDTEILLCPLWSFISGFLLTAQL